MFVFCFVFCFFCFLFFSSSKKVTTTALHLRSGFQLHPSSVDPNWTLLPSSITTIKMSTAHYKILDRLTSEDFSTFGFSSDESHSIYKELTAILEEHGASAPETWREISSRILTPDQPFTLHQMLFYGCYADYPSDTPPAWIPNM